jgi:alkylation response protein AidB-like acyl-CoA dehydrogenase
VPDEAAARLSSRVGRSDDQGRRAGRLHHVIDRAIQAHGALGVSDDTPLASWWRNGRLLRPADDPDEVHEQVIARHELARWP